jgi:tripartite-type tricarboxylate transporter receptor subunit TctC
MVRAFVILAAFVAAHAIAGRDAAAQILTGRPITVIIPFTPGASSDTFQRLVAKKVTENTGQLIIVESRPGGGGAVGALAAKQAPPDGHTLFQANTGSHAANVALYASLPYDPIKDFQPITLMWSFPQLLAVPDESPAKSAPDLAALAKTKAGGLSFGSQGNGSSGHLLGETFKLKTAAANMVHVPYRGAGPAALDVATGRLDFLFVSYASALSFIQSGKVRVLAVSSAKRLTALPNVPTMAEAGFPGFEMDTWFGLLAPAGTPEGVVDKLHAAFARAVKHPDVAKQMEDQGAEAVTSTPKEFAAFIAAETERLGTIIRGLGARAD